MSTALLTVMMLIDVTPKNTEAASCLVTLDALSLLFLLMVARFQTTAQPGARYMSLSKNFKNARQCVVGVVIFRLWAWSKCTSASGRVYTSQVMHYSTRLSEHMQLYKTCMCVLFT